MPTVYKTFIVVFLVALIVFAVGRPLFIRLMAPEDFARRRNLWLLLCATSFLAPNIWLYVLIAAPAILIASKRDPNPVALYFFVLLAVPPVKVAIPTFGLIGQVFPMDHLRLLSLTLLLPLAMRLSAERAAARLQGLGADSDKRMSAVDVLLLSYLGLQVMLMFPYDSFTSTGRRILLLAIDVVLPYFVVSRACRSRAAIAEAMAAFVIAMLVLAPLAVYEFFRGWMLFAIIEEHWDAARLYFPLYRGPFLRAQTTAGHSIFLGYFMAMAFGMWLYLKNRIHEKGWQWLCILTLMAGLIAALARGPWVGAVGVFFVYLLLGPKAASRSLKGMAMLGALVAVGLLSPWGEQILDYLPFIGSVDLHTITYRQQIAAGSWLLIQQNPFVGSPHYMAYMEQFRTGEGIIDLVNTYAGVALSSGLVGFGLFVGVFLVAMWKAWRVVRHLSPLDPDAALMGGALIACVVGTLLVLATTSFLHAMPYFAWALAGLTMAYVRSSAVERQESELPARTAVRVERALP
ncbi:hypothetical protein GEOBC_01530 [Geobacteraceae bacterium]|nr:hypothetical protein GEOBC_01530 [Geobacteraceae bacterium]